MTACVLLCCLWTIGWKQWFFELLLSFWSQSGCSLTSGITRARWPRERLLPRYFLFFWISGFSNTLVTFLPCSDARFEIQHRVYRPECTELLPYDRLMSDACVDVHAEQVDRIKSGLHRGLAIINLLRPLSSLKNIDHR